VLLGLGDVVEVLEPEALRDDMRATAEEVVRLYRRH
jgi:predicted DNA-binding transcriptional regulator YafY